MHGWWELKWYSHYGKPYGGQLLKNSKTESSSGPAIPLPGMYPKEVKAGSQIDICSQQHCPQSSERESNKCPLGMNG